MKIHKMESLISSRDSNRETRKESTEIIMGLGEVISDLTGALLSAIDVINHRTLRSEWEGPTKSAVERSMKAMNKARAFMGKR